MDDPETLVRLACAAELGGADGFRVASVEVVARLRARTELPIIGIVKRQNPEGGVYITPSVADAKELIDAGADLVAADCESRGRDGDSFAEIVSACHAAGVAVMADCATVRNAVDARRAGADLVATTLAGYTQETQGLSLPALSLARRLVQAGGAPVVVEGGVQSPVDIADAFAAGAYAVVVGSAVTDPEAITRRFRSAASDRHHDRLLAATKMQADVGDGTENPSKARESDSPAIDEAP